jgi:hypothetical protein
MSPEKMGPDFPEKGPDRQRLAARLALAAAVQILKCKAELDNLKAELAKLKRPKKNDARRLHELDRAWHVMMDAIQAIDGKNEPLVNSCSRKWISWTRRGENIGATVSAVRSRTGSPYRRARPR